MDNPVLDRIKNFAIKELKNQFGFCGCADSDNMAFLNSYSPSGKDITIKIEVVEK